MLGLQPHVLDENFQEYKVSDVLDYFHDVEKMLHPFQGVKSVYFLNGVLILMVSLIRH